MLTGAGLGLVVKLFSIPEFSVLLLLFSLLALGIYKVIGNRVGRESVKPICATSWQHGIFGLFTIKFLANNVGMALFSAWQLGVKTILGPEGLCIWGQSTTLRTS